MQLEGCKPCLKLPQRCQLPLRPWLNVVYDVVMSRLIGFSCSREPALPVPVCSHGWTYRFDPPTSLPSCVPCHGWWPVVYRHGFAACQFFLRGRHGSCLVVIVMVKASPELDAVAIL